jgi:hypothetical protein
LEFKETLPSLVDVINTHATDYLNDPTGTPDKHAALLGAVGAIAALASKNRMYQVSPISNH